MFSRFLVTGKHIFRNVPTKNVNQKVIINKFSAQPQTLPKQKLWDKLSVNIKKKGDDLFISALVIVPTTSIVYYSYCDKYYNWDWYFRLYLVRDNLSDKILLPIKRILYRSKILKFQKEIAEKYDCYNEEQSRFLKFYPIDFSPPSSHNNVYNSIYYVGYNFSKDFIHRYIHEIDFETYFEHAYHFYSKPKEILEKFSHISKKYINNNYILKKHINDAFKLERIPFRIVKDYINCIEVDTIISCDYMRHDYTESQWKELYDITTNYKLKKFINNHIRSLKLTTHTDIKINPDSKSKENKRDKHDDSMVRIMKTLFGLSIYEKKISKSLTPEEFIPYTTRPENLNW